MTGYDAPTGFAEQPADGYAAEIAALLELVTQTSGADAISDAAELMLDISHGVVAVADGHAVGYLALRPSQDPSTPETRAEIVMSPALRGEARHEVFGLLIDTSEHPSASGQPLHLWAFQVSDSDHAVFEAHGLTQARELLQMRTALPVDQPDIETASFRPGIDDDEWLQVNNRAFAWHPDQSGWTAENLRVRMAESWFDADGFLLHRIDGRLAGFCWTKGHTWTEPPLGEIYVIAVDPEFTGRGLGRQLSLAGLQHLHAAGFSTGMLYVESDNEPAVAMYHRIGFHVAHADRMYTL